MLDVFVIYLFCLVLFFFIIVYSYISDIFFPWITRCTHVCVYFRHDFSLYHRFFNNLLPAPDRPKSLTICAGERTPGQFKFCLQSVCNDQLFIDQS